MVAKEVMAIKFGNTTGHSIKKFLELPFAGKHPKLILKSAKAAAAEAAVTAAEAIAVVDLEETNRLAAEFEALGGTLCASAGSHTSGSACRRPAR
jgi:dihydropteroate synthase